MSKAAKIISSVIAAIILLFGISIILVTTLINPNNFKNQISAAVQKNTGRQFAINGDIKWSFFPWIGLRMEQLSLGNAPGFKQQAFAQVDEADVNIRLLPLFYGKAEMGTVTLKNLTLNLSQNAKGQNNWSDITAASKSSKNNATQATNSQVSKTNVQFPQLTISNIDISNAAINWSNLQNGQNATLNHLYLESNGANFNKSFPVKLKFDLTSNKPAIHAQIAFDSDITIQSNAQQYTLHGLNLTGNLLGKQYPKGNVPFSLNTDATIDLKNQTLDAKNILAKIDILKIQGDLSGTKISQAPEFTSNLNIPTFNLRTLLADLGEKTQIEDPAALQNVALKAQTEFSPKFVKLDNITAKLDDTTLNGKFSFANFTNKNFDFNLKLDQINLSRYMTATTTTASNQKPTSSKVAASSSNTTASSGTLPINLLRQLNGQGSFQIGKLTVANLTTSNITTQVAAKNGVIKISPVTANIYQGKSQGAIVINAQGAVPTITANETLANVQVGDLMNDVSKTSKLQITGIGNLTMNVRTQGQNNAALIQALNGSIKFAVNNGAIKNLDIGQQIYAAIEHFLKSNVNDGTNSNQTTFSSLTGTVNIVNGIANNNDLSLKSPSLQVSGKGSANLINQTINYAMNATALGSPFGKDIINLQQQIGGSIPITISGSLSNPHAGPDYATIATALLKGQFKQQVEKRFNGNNIGEAINSIKGLLGS